MSSPNSSHASLLDALRDASGRLSDEDVWRAIRIIYGGRRASDALTVEDGMVEDAQDSAAALMDVDGPDTATVSVGDEVDAAAAELLNRRSASEMRAFFREMQWGDSDGLDGLALPLIEDIVVAPPPQEFVSGVADTLRRLGVDEGGVAEALAPFGAVAVAPSAPAPAIMYPVAVFYTNAADESPLSSVTTSAASSSASSRETSPSTSSDGSASDGDSVGAASVAPPDVSAQVMPTAAGAVPGAPFYPGFTPIVPAVLAALPQTAPLPPSHLPYVPGEYELEADDDCPLAVHAYFRRPSVQAALGGYRDANNAAEGTISDRFAYAVVDAKKILEGRGMSSVPAQWIFSVRTDFEFVFALGALASMILSRPLSPILNHHFVRDDDLNGEIEDCRTVEGAVLRMQIDDVARGRLSLVEEQLVLRRRALQAMFDAGFYYDTDRYEVASHTIRALGAFSGHEMSDAAAFAYVERFYPALRAFAKAKEAIVGN